MLTPLGSSHASLQAGMAFRRFPGGHQAAGTPQTKTCPGQCSTYPRPAPPPPPSPANTCGLAPEDRCGVPQPPAGPTAAPQVYPTREPFPHATLRSPTTEVLPPGLSAGSRAGRDQLPPLSPRPPKPQPGGDVMVGEGRAGGGDPPHLPFLLPAPQRGGRAGRPRRGGPGAGGGFYRAIPTPGGAAPPSACVCVCLCVCACVCVRMRVRVCASPLPPPHPSRPGGTVPAAAPPPPHGAGGARGGKRGGGGEFLGD